MEHYWCHAHPHRDGCDRNLASLRASECIREFIFPSPSDAVIGNQDRGFTAQVIGDKLGINSTLMVLPAHLVTPFTL